MGGKAHSQCILSSVRVTTKRVGPPSLRVPERHSSTRERMCRQQRSIGRIALCRWTRGCKKERMSNGAVAACDAVAKMCRKRCGTKSERAFLTASAKL